MATYLATLPVGSLPFSPLVEEYRFGVCLLDDRILVLFKSEVSWFYASIAFLVTCPLLLTLVWVWYHLSTSHLPRTLLLAALGIIVIVVVVVAAAVAVAAIKGTLSPL
ncbi:hypothetical protein Tco_0294756 [Tanacetum coccineum]